MKSQHLQLIPLGVALLIVFLSTAVLWAATIEHGTYIFADSSIYIQTGVNFHEGNGLGMYSYQPETDITFYTPTTHYPPFTSIVYGAIMNLGIHPAVTPSIVSLVGWISLLAGVGGLTYRLSNSIVAASLAIIVLAIHPFLLGLMNMAMSEPIFLPLLVWLMVVLVDLPTHQRHRGFRLALASLLLALLLLTRYSGIIVLAATMLWWLWKWWDRESRNWRELLQGMFAFVISILPLGIWIAYHSFSNDDDVVASGHFVHSHHTFVAGLYHLGRSITKISMPFILFSEIDEDLWWLPVIIYIIVFLSITGLLLKYRASFTQFITAFRSPIIIFLVLYTLLYTVVQPFFRFAPMDVRDVTTILCLALPWFFASLVATLPHQWSYSLLAVYTALVITLAVGPMIYYGPPTWVSFIPLRLDYLTNTEHYDPEVRGNDSGLWRFFSITPVRALDSINHHQALTSKLQSEESPVVVITNEETPLIFSPYSFVAIQPHSFATRQRLHGVDIWLDEGSCTSQHKIMIVVFDWPFLPFVLPEQITEPVQLRRAIEQKCPGTPRQEYNHATLYELVPPTTMEEDGT